VTDLIAVSTPTFGKPGGAKPYSQALAVPPGRGLLFTAGVVAREPDGRPAAPDDAGAQTRHILAVLCALLGEAGCTLDDVVRITIYVRDIERDLPSVQAARDEVWTTHAPVATMVEVSRLFSDAVRVEIDAVALLPVDFGK
jgi:2-iminobutanoate/2-iminopropanoate deaminase